MREAACRTPGCLSICVADSDAGCRAPAATDDDAAAASSVPAAHSRRRFQSNLQCRVLRVSILRHSPANRRGFIAELHRVSAAPLRHTDRRPDRRLVDRTTGARQRDSFSRDCFSHPQPLPRNSRTHFSVRRSLAWPRASYRARKSPDDTGITHVVNASARRFDFLIYMSLVATR